MEKFTSKSLIAPVDFESRKNFLLKNSQEFQIPVVGEYRGTEKQNTALLKFLKNNSAFRQKWESELMAIQSSSSEKKVEIRNEAKAQVNQISDKDKPTFPARTPGEFLAAHGIDLSVAPAGIRNNNPFNIKWTNSDFQKRILVDAVEPSKNKDQGNRQVVFKSPEAGMASGIRLLLHRYNYNKLRTVSDLIANNSIGWTQDGTKGNKLGTNAAREIAERMGIGVNDYLDFSNRDTLTKFIKSLLYQEHGDTSRVYANVTSSVIDKIV